LTTDIHAAQAVELTAGIEKSGIDFQMTPTAVSRIHGALSWQGADWHGRSVNLQLSSLETHRPAGAARLDEEKGTFEFQRIFPGSYAIVAFAAGGEDRIGAWQQVDVTDQPLAVAVELRHGVDVHGTIEIENGGNSTKPVALSQCQILLTANVQGGLPGSQIHANDDGTFTLKGVMPGPFRLRTEGPAVFLKSAWLGSTDITHTAIDFSGGVGRPLRIVMSANTATIRGSAPAGDSIFLQSTEDTPFRRNRDMSSDQNGQFAFEGLAPGTYRIAIVESRGAIPDGGGQEITVREGETAMVSLKPEHVQF
jgi:protocatechuate 3,4-dioxygenase beta subunit